MANRIGLECPDCKTVCAINIVLLTTCGRIVYLTACPRCADRITIKAYHPINSATFNEAVRWGLPVVDYGKRK